MTRSENYNESAARPSNDAPVEGKENSADPSQRVELPSDFAELIADFGG